MRTTNTLRTLSETDFAISQAGSKILLISPFSRRTATTTTAGNGTSKQLIPDMPTAIIAYNYETQQWVEGPDARRLRHAQYLDEISLLSGADGERYARFCGITDRAAAIARLQTDARHCCK